MHTNGVECPSLRSSHEQEGKSVKQPPKGAGHPSGGHTTQRNTSTSCEDRQKEQN